MGSTYIFDEISYLSLRFLKRGENIDAVYFFKISEKVDINLIQNISQIKNINFINFNDLEYPYTLPYSMMKSHEKNDNIYESLIKDKMPLKLLNKLYSSPEIELVFKMELIDRIHSQYNREMMINNTVKDLSGKIIYFSKFNYSLYGEDTLLSEKVEKRRKIISVRISCLWEKMRELVSLFFPFYIFFRSFGGFKLKQNKKGIKVGINSNLPGLFGKNYHYFYYLTETQYGISKEDYLLIDERFSLKNEYFENYGNRDINCYNIYEKYPVSMSCIWKIMTRFLFTWTFCFFSCIFANSVIISSTRKVLSDYVKWNVFFDRYELEKYVNVLMPDNPSKCIIFNKNNVETIFIFPDNYTDDYHSGLGEEIPAQTKYSYMKYDSALVYGEKVKRYFEKSKTAVNLYIGNGVIHSQRIHEIRNCKYPKKLDISNLFDVSPRKIIAVFDIGFINWGFMHKADAIKFAESILQLLDDFPDIGIIFKEKKDFSKYEDVYKVYQKIGEHPRGAYIRKIEGSDIYSFDIIALCDMVVSACFTSAHAEALGSKTRSVYYDVKGDYIGKNYYFNKFPDMVAHNYDELTQLVEKWLYEVSESEFDTYLNKYVKGEIDEFLDQRAIDRLQNKIYGW